MKVWSESVETFLEAATWLGEEDAPMVAALKAVAEKLDEEVQAAMVNQFGVTYRTLMKKKEGDGSEVDPLDALLNG